MSTPLIVKALVAEDEPVLLAELCDLLARLWPELAIVGAAEDGIQALRLLDEHEPDVLFLDIEMPALSGLELAKHASGRCHVVFVTAYDRYAVAAFEEGAVDYVMKPLSAARVATAIARVKERLASAPAKLDGILEVLARTRPSAAVSSVDHGFAWQRCPRDHDRGDLLCQGGQQVHDRRHAGS